MVAVILGENLSGVLIAEKEALVIKVFLLAASKKFIRNSDSVC